jgi:hypothetical protein
MKTSELTGAALDWAVAKCEGVLMRWERSTHDEAPLEYSPSTDWVQGGPIIEREKIQIKENGHGHWFAKIGKGKWLRGPTPLIAAMRCYVASKLGDEVELPEELK